MNIKRFTVALRVALFGHIFNWMWQPKDVRRRRRGYVTAKAVLDYLQQYVPYIKDVPADEPALPEDERIFSIWLQGEDNAPGISRPDPACTFY